MSVEPLRWPRSGSMSLVSTNVSALAPYSLTIASFGWSGR